MYITTLSVKKGLNDAFLTSYFHVKHTWQVKSLKHGVDFAKYDFFYQSREIFDQKQTPTRSSDNVNPVFSKTKNVFFVS